MSHFQTQNRNRHQKQGNRNRTQNRNQKNGFQSGYGNQSIYGSQSKQGIHLKQENHSPIRHPKQRNHPYQRRFQHQNLNQNLNPNLNPLFQNQGIPFQGQTPFQTQGIQTPYSFQNQGTQGIQFQDQTPFQNQGIQNPFPFPFQNQGIQNQGIQGIQEQEQFIQRQHQKHFRFPKEIGFNLRDVTLRNNVFLLLSDASRGKALRESMIEFFSEHGTPIEIFDHMFQFRASARENILQKLNSRVFEDIPTEELALTLERSTVQLIGDKFITDSFLNWIRVKPPTNRKRNIVIVGLDPGVHDEAIKYFQDNGVLIVQEKSEQEIQENEHKNEHENEEDEDGEFIPFRAYKYSFDSDYSFATECQFYSILDEIKNTK